MIHRVPARHGTSMSLCRAVFFLLLPIVFIETSLGQPSQPRRDPPPVDTTGGDISRHDSLRTSDSLSLAGADSLAAGDSLAMPRRPDTVVIGNPGAPLGALVPLEEGAGYALIGKRELVWDRYFTAFDLLADKLPAYPLSQGAPGLVRAFSYAGASPDAVSGSFNGRPLWGALGRAYELDLYPVEYLERLEILRGARAAILGSGESLIALNFTAPRYDVQGSYVRLWYAQGANNTSNADITFARNIGDRTNLALGFRRLGGDGVFPSRNQNISGWSARGAARWDPSDNLSVSLTEMFSDATRGLNGGLLPGSSRQAIFAEVFNDTLSERTLRHDVTLATRWYPRSADIRESDTAAHTVRRADTTLRVDGNIYFTYAERELQVAARRAMLPSAFSRAGIVGARAGFTIPVERFRLLANGIVEYGDNDRARFEGGGVLEIPLGSIIAVRGGAKIHGYAGDVFVTLAGEGDIRLADSFAVRGAVRTTSLLDPRADCPAPDADEVLWRGLGEHYTGSMVEAGMQWRNGRARVSLEGFLRGAVPQECTDLGAYTVAGASASFSIPYSFLTLDNHLVATVAPEDYRSMPLLYGTSDLFAQLRLLDGNLDLRLGTVLEYQSSLPAIQYRDAQGDIGMRQGSTLSEQPPIPVWTAYAQGRIGTAYIRVEMYNILDNQFYTINRYPTFGRAVTIAVNWALID